METNWEICSNHGKLSLKLFRLNDLHLFSVFLLSYLIIFNWPIYLLTIFWVYSGNPQLILICLSLVLPLSKSRAHRVVADDNLAYYPFAFAFAFAFTALSFHITVKMSQFTGCFWETRREALCQIGFSAL